MTPEDIKDWLGLEVTKDFMARIYALKEFADSKVHSCLETYEAKQAEYWNAGMHQLQEVLDLPQRMIEEAEEEK